MNVQDEYPNDAVNIAPDLHKVIYEDEKMRVLKVSVPPNATANMHWHPRNINYVLAGGTLKFEKLDGSIAEVVLSNGQVTSALEESSHAVENVGESTVETIQIELKS